MGERSSEKFRCVCQKFLHGSSQGSARISTDHDSGKLEHPSPVLSTDDRHEYERLRSGKDTKIVRSLKLPWRSVHGPWQWDHNGTKVSLPFSAFV